MLSRNTAAVPTIASEVPHAVITAFWASSAVRCESSAFTTTWRHASPPPAFTYRAHAGTVLTTPWNRPGRNGEPVSATTDTVMVFAVTPTSVAASRVVRHSPAVVAVTEVGVIPPLICLPPLHADPTSAITTRLPTRPPRLTVPHDLSKSRTARVWCRATGTVARLHQPATSRRSRRVGRSGETVRPLTLLVVSIVVAWVEPSYRGGAAAAYAAR